MKLTYDPSIFNVNDIASARSIILTPEDSTTQTRWTKETPYLADLITQNCEISPDSFLLDYGCGIGRMAKELILRHGCRVVGVDISPSMRALAPLYVASDRFFSCPPAMLDGLIERGMSFDGALSIWVLQHCQLPAGDIASIRRALRPAGKLFVVNAVRRCVPTLEHGWVNDGIDLRSELSREFVLLAEGKLAIDQTSPLIAGGSFWATLRRP
jgi:SAM-dependent methyltransferase